MARRALALVIALAACRAPTDPPDAAPAPVSASVAPPPPPARVWYAPKVPSIGRLVGDDVEDFVGAYRDEAGAKATLFAVDGARLAPAWSVDVPVPSGRELFFVVSGARVGWSTGDAVHVLDAATGTELRTVDVGGPTTGLCPHGDRDSSIFVGLPGTKYVAIFSLETGKERNNSGVSPRRCGEPRRSYSPPSSAKLPKDLELAPNPFYSYEPGVFVARTREGRHDPVVLGISPAGFVTWRLPLGGDGGLEVVDAAYPDGEAWLLASRAPAAPARLVAIDPKGSVAKSLDVARGARTLTRGDARLYVTSATQLEIVDRKEGRVLATFGDAAP